MFVGLYLPCIGQLYTIRRLLSDILGVVQKRLLSLSFYICSFFPLQYQECSRAGVCSGDSSVKFEHSLREGTGGYEGTEWSAIRGSHQQDSGVLSETSRRNTQNVSRTLVKSA